MIKFDSGLSVAGLMIVLVITLFSYLIFGQVEAPPQRIDSCASIYDKAFRWTVEAEQKKGSTTDEDLVNVGIARAYSELYMACREKGR